MEVRSLILHTTGTLSSGTPAGSRKSSMRSRAMNEALRHRLEVAVEGQRNGRPLLATISHSAALRAPTDALVGSQARAFASAAARAAQSGQSPDAVFYGCAATNWVVSPSLGVGTTRFRR